MGLPWVRLDTNFAQNPKILYLIEDKKYRAIVAYISGLGYAGAQGTDGFLPKACLPVIHATRTDAKHLVAVLRDGSIPIRRRLAFTARFLADFLDPRVRYYVWSWRDPRPMLADLAGAIRRYPSACA